MKTKTEITTQYAPFVQRRSGGWCKLQPFASHSKEEAERYIETHKSSNPYMGEAKYKIMRRTVIFSVGEWEDVENEKERGTP